MKVTAHEPPAAPAANPFSPAEAMMTEVWEEVLGIDGVGPTTTSSLEVATSCW
ncbi:hypothetical protein AB0E10_15430 [Streptomyces sp. NPDC048045]|uniref:hypothetical protein n=1 Tax=Streptomyces sp. NPDC048045 TaxID=3154710 RepID=UPI003449F9C3